MSARCASSDTDHTCVYEGIKCTSSVYPCEYLHINDVSLSLCVALTLRLSPPAGLEEQAKEDGTR